jgi:hypothetical protein
MPVAVMLLVAATVMITVSLMTRPPGRQVVEKFFW